MAKKLFVRTYGCQMNVYDSARMADVLAPLGYAPAEAADEEVVGTADKAKFFRGCHVADDLGANRRRAHEKNRHARGRA